MREILEETKGKIWTNGKGIDGRVVYPGEGLKKEDFYQITEEEYQARMAEQNADELI